MSSTASTSSRDGDGGSTGRIATLSNDALYAPLSTFADFSAMTTSTTTTPTFNPNIKQRQLRHSLALQTPPSLRESSLLTFLSSSICTNLKTCHSQEYALYRSLGSDSFSKYGMGDGNHDGASYSNSIRSLLENKLSNRSLILVGGGVHSSNNTSASTYGKGSGGGGDVGTTSLTATVTSSIANGGGKRVRKRVGGNGIFGCISNKRRKKILLNKWGKTDEHSSMTKKHRDGDGDELKVVARNREKVKQEPSPATPISQQPQQVSLQFSDEVVHPQHVRVHRPSHQEQDEATEIQSNIQEKVGSVIKDLNKMWIRYIHQLRRSSFQNDHVSSSHPSTTSNTDNSTPPSSLDQRKQLSHVLATCEHVGMAVTIKKCPSRRHLVCRRCIVVKETKETWSMAMLVSKKKKKKKTGKETKKKNNDDGEDSGCRKVKEESESISEVEQAQPPPPLSLSSEHSTNTLWKIIMVPKRGTALEITLPWKDYDVSTKNEQEEYVSVHLLED